MVRYNDFIENSDDKDDEEEGTDNRAPITVGDVSLKIP